VSKLKIWPLDLGTYIKYPVPRKIVLTGWPKNVTQRLLSAIPHKILPIIPSIVHLRSGLTVDGFTNDDER
jgi:folate-dependent phosphoribosylglycinamide formyltransferase PurN